MTAIDGRALPVVAVVDGELFAEIAPRPALPAPRAGLVVDGEVVAVPFRSLLDADPVTGEYPTCLRGGVVTDPDEIAAIGARIAYADLPWSCVPRNSGRLETRSGV